jgi:hypothetical protein
VGDLTIDDLPRFLPLRGTGPTRTDDLHRDSDRRQGITQLMGEHRQKLILRPIRLGQAGRRLLILLRAEIFAQQCLRERGE